MGSRIECFWLTSITSVRVSLRRYRELSEGADKCPGLFGYHNASVDVGDEAKALDPRGLLGRGVDRDLDEDARFPRWPRFCGACGTAFVDTDAWHLNEDRLFTGAPDGQLYTVRNMPAGAMYDATWWNHPGPDGVTLTVILPPGGFENAWHPDSNSKDGRPWTRTGTIPKVTCTPSILTDRYHGFLTDGWLVEC